MVGCATLPPPTREELAQQALGNVDVPAQWSAPSSSAAPVAVGWLAAFNDPRLTALAQEAIAQNPDLLIAAARVEQADAALGVAQAQLRPALGLLARTSTKPIDDLVAVVSGIVLKVWWEVDLWGRMRYARNAARASRDAASADYQFAQQSIAAATARAWFLAIETDGQRKLGQQLVESATLLVELAEQRARIGAGTDNELAAARVALASYQDALQQMELAHRQSLRALELLTGRYPAAELATSSALVTVPPDVPAGIPAQMLERRPDVIAAEYRVAVAFNRVGEAKAARWPSLTLSANAGRVADDLDDLESGNDRSLESAGARIVVPFYLGGSLSEQVNLRNAEQRQAIANYTLTALRAWGEAEDALDADAVLAARERLALASLAQSRQMLTLDQTAYRIGKADLRAVAQSQLALYTSEAASLHLRRERLSQRVGLHLALGGAFMAEPDTAQESQDPKTAAR